jgi:type IV secretion system protein VirB2
VLLLIPELALAQSSPFMTGATALQTNILAWLTPIAVILVMVLGAMAMANRITLVSCERCNPYLIGTGLHRTHTVCPDRFA